MKCFAHPRHSLGAPFSRVAAAAIFALAALLAACSGSSEGAGAPDPGVPSVISHSARVDEGNGQIVFVSVALSAPARAAVEYENEIAGKFRTALSETAVEHVIPVVRLRASATYRYAVAVEKADGAFAYPARGEFTTGELPDILLASMWSEASGRSSQDLIAADYEIETPEGWRQSVVMMDALGYAVWHYAHSKPQNLFAVRLPPGGDIMYQLGNCCVIEITPLGETVNELAAARTHHDFLPLEDGRVLYIDRRGIDLDDSASGGDAETTIWVDAINALDPASGESERVWDPMDFWDINDPAQWGADTSREGWNSVDWLHMNSLEKSADGGYIASFRNISQVASISPDFKTVRWRLGGPDSDFDFPDPTDKFAWQHTATELPNGNILVFDNRAKLPADEGEGYYSRALELRLDFENKTAVKAWEFSPEPRMYSDFASSAYRLDNGNTLVNFGRSEDPATIPIAIVEADAQGREVFRLETMDSPTAHRTPRRYRAYPGPKSIMGETTLRAPRR